MSVISSDSTLTELNARFTKVPFDPFLWISMRNILSFFLSNRNKFCLFSSLSPLNESVRNLKIMNFPQPRAKIVVNRVCNSLNGVALEITLTVPLKNILTGIFILMRTTIDMKYIPIIWEKNKTMIFEDFELERDIKNLDIVSSSPEYKISLKSADRVSSSPDYKYH